MSIECEAVTSEVLPPGSMVDQESGKEVKWGERTVLFVKFPNERFHSQIYVSGALPIGDGKATFAFAVRNNKPLVQFKGFVKNQPDFQKDAVDPFKATK